MKPRLSFVACVMAAIILAGCGGGKVVVNTPPTTPASPAPAEPVVVARGPEAPTTVVVKEVPSTPAPPVQVVELGPSPGSDYVRVEGYYNWLGDHYAWTPATWVRVPRAGATYVPGHWQASPGGYSWKPGYWQ
jgi:hypothetical protein